MYRSSTDRTATDATPLELSESEYHRVLANDCRRRTLDVLDGQSRPVALADLAAEVAARDCGGGVPDVERVESTAATLHHVHLPLMADLGVLDYDPDAHLVEP